MGEAVTGTDRRRDVSALLLAVVPVAAASISGNIATLPNLTVWYNALAKPPFNPPNWVFAPVWTLLYLLMIFAAWRILRLPTGTAGRTVALTLFFAHLTLDGAWSWLFFVGHNPLFGLLDIAPQFVIILATIRTFHRLDRVAAWSMVPLAAWIAYATVLNAWIWQLNP